MRFALLAFLAVLIPGTALAEDAGCDPTLEVLNWAAEALIDIRDRDATGVGANAGYIVDAANFADDRAHEAGWPENYFGVLDELAYVAATISDNEGVAEPTEARSLLFYADMLGDITGERCGPDVLPVLPRPGVADARACPQVIEALEAIEHAMPALERENAGGVLLLPVATSVRKARDHADYSQWDLVSVRALDDIEDFATRIARGEGAPNRIADLIGSYANRVAAQAQAICKDHDIPMLAAAGQ